jgi:hypothetical protein
MALTAAEIEMIQTASDYHKAVFGCRPRGGGGLNEAEEAAYWLGVYENASAEMKRRKSTPEGRDALRDDGWLLDGDPSPEFRECRREVVC